MQSVGFSSNFSYDHIHMDHVLSLNNFSNYIYCPSLASIGILTILLICLNANKAFNPRPDPHPNLVIKKSLIDKLDKSKTLNLLKLIYALRNKDISIDLIRVINQFLLFDFRTVSYEAEWGNFFINEPDKQDINTGLLTEEPDEQDINTGPLTEFPRAPKFSKAQSARFKEIRGSVILFFLLYLAQEFLDHVIPAKILTKAIDRDLKLLGPNKSLGLFDYSLNKKNLEMEFWYLERINATAFLDDTQTIFYLFRVYVETQVASESIFTQFINYYRNNSNIVPVFCRKVQKWQMLGFIYYVTHGSTDLIGPETYKIDDPSITHLSILTCTGLDLSNSLGPAIGSRLVLKSIILALRDYQGGPTEKIFMSPTHFLPKNLSISTNRLVPPEKPRLLRSIIRNLKYSAGNVG